MNISFHIQNYEWGKLGNSSCVAQLAKAADPNLKISPTTPYAELWMGTHPNGPSKLTCSGVLLQEYIEKNADCLGAKVIEVFGQQLPFLFKVLSVAKALSIQAHPDKELAKKLHESRPDLYKDPNHKPELAIAVTDFEAMCGFRPVQEIKHFLQKVPELESLVGKETVGKFLTSDEAGLSKALRDCFHSFMTKPQEAVTEQLSKLLTRVSTLDESSRAALLAPLVERLNQQFPNDIGCFSVYFLNVVCLKPGESVYLGANEPHAYLSGDCIECMACSDNVVRAGLTPKFKDVETLCQMLTYQMGSAESKLFSPVVESKYQKLYAPGVKDFAVSKIDIPASSASVPLKVRESASIVLVISGEGESKKKNKLSTGFLFFLPANEEFTVEKVDQDLVMYQAFANV